MELEISSSQIKKAFSKIKEDMSKLNSRIEQLEKENKKLKKNLESNSKINPTKSDYTLVGNILSGKVHINTCPYAKKIAIQNIEKFEDIKHALRLKYRKCSCIGTI